MEEKKQIEQLEESNEKDKKGSLFKAVFISLLLVGLSVACGWFACSYFAGNKNTAKQVEEEKEQKNEKQKETEKQEEWKSLGTDISKVKDLYDFYTLGSFTYGKSLPNGGLSLSKKEILDILASSVQESDLTNITKQDSYTGKGTLSYEKAEKILNKIFGKNFTMPTCNGNDCEFGGGCPYSISYQIESKSFGVSWGPCGNTSGPDTVSHKLLRTVENVLEKKDEIKVIEKVIYVTHTDCDESRCYYNVYSNPQKTNSIGQLEILMNESGKNHVEKFIDKAGTITSLYRKAADGTYYFVSSEITDN